MRKSLVTAIVLIGASFAAAQPIVPGSAKDEPPPPPEGQIGGGPLRTLPDEIVPETAPAAPRPVTGIPGPRQHDEGPAAKHEPAPNYQNMVAAAAEIESRRERRLKDRLWVRSEYVLWLIKEADLPPLLTTGLTSDFRPGAIGNANTRVVLGGGDAIDFHERHGARFSAGLRLGEESPWSVEGSYMFLGSRNIAVAGTSPGTTPSAPFLARPFFDVVNLREDASLVAYPGLIGGSFDLQFTNEFNGAELNAALAIWERSGEHGEVRVDLLGGFRYWNLEEGINIREITDVNPAAATFPGRRISIIDTFETENEFYGGQLGVRASMRKKHWQLDWTGKLAIGNNDRSANVRGATVIDTTPATVANGGLLALTSNSGRFSSSEFVVIPELNVHLGLRLTERLQVFMGYSFLIWDNVWRPGDQIDRGLNPNLIPTSATFGAGGPARPAFPGRDTDFFAHGIHFGAEFKY